MLLALLHGLQLHVECDSCPDPSAGGTVSACYVCLLFYFLEFLSFHISLLWLDWCIFLDWVLELEHVLEPQSASALLIYELHV